MKKTIFLLFIFFLNTNNVFSYEPWKCITKTKCVSSQEGFNVEFVGKTKNNLPYKGRITIPAIDSYTEGTFQIKSNNAPSLIKGFAYVNGIKFYVKKDKIYKSVYSEGHEFKGEFYKSRRAKNGKIVFNTGDTYKGSLYDRDGKAYKTGTYKFKKSGKIKYVNGKEVSRSGFKQKKSSGRVGINFGFLTPVLALISIYAGVLIVGHPFMPLWRSASDPFTKILLIIGVIIAYLVVISILFALIGFGWENFDTPPEGLRPRFFGDSR